MRTTTIVIPALFALASLAEAANVSVQVKDHSLRISSKDPCSFLIDQFKLQSTSFRVAPTSASTTINGSSTPLIFTGIDKDVRIEIDDFADVAVRDATIGRDLKIEIDGDCTIDLYNLFVVRDLTMECDESASIDFDVSTVGDDLTIDVDEGNSFIQLRLNDVQDDTRIELGKPSNGLGNTVVLDGGQFRDKLTIEGSSGDDLVASGQFAPLVFGKVDVKLSSGDNAFEMFGAQFLQKVSIRGGNDEDFVSLVNSTFETGVSIDLDDGFNVVEINGSEFTGDLSMRTREDVDSVRIQTSVIGDDLSIRTEDATDSIELKILDVHDDLRIDSGDGNDSILQTNVTVNGESDID